MLADFRHSITLLEITSVAESGGEDGVGEIGGEMRRWEPILSNGLHQERASCLVMSETI